MLPEISARVRLADDPASQLQRGADEEHRAVLDRGHAAGCVTCGSLGSQGNLPHRPPGGRIALVDKTTYFVCIVLLSIPCKSFAARVSQNMHRRATNGPVREPPI
jgi:hypothetical protein